MSTLVEEVHSKTTSAFQQPEIFYKWLSLVKSTFVQCLMPETMDNTVYSGDDIFWAAPIIMLALKRNINYKPNSYLEVCKSSLRLKYVLVWTC